MWGIGDAITGLIIVVLILLPVAVFGVWKIVELVIWLFQNVQIIVG